MNLRGMKFRKASLGAVAALALAAASLGGCVVYPSGYAYNSYGYGGYGYAPPVYVAPPPVFGGIFIGGGGGWGRRWR